MRQRRRVQSAIYRARKKGYDVPSLPPIPEQLRQRDVQRLSKITGERIRQKVTGASQRAQVTQPATRPASATDFHNALYDAYMRERRRAQQAVRRARKKGLYVPEIPAWKRHPTQEDIDELKAITPANIRSNQPQKSQAQREQYIPDEGQLIIDRVYEIINNAFYDSSSQRRLIAYYANALMEYLNNAISIFGTEAVAKHFRSHPDIEQLTQEVLKYHRDPAMSTYFYNRLIVMIMSIGNEREENNPIEDISEDYWEEDE